MSEKTSLKLVAYNKIKEKIINCEYPPGYMLNEGLLRDELNISRTPIRDALSRLEQDGLIYIIPKKGIQVSSLSINDINLIFEVRLLYEPYILLNYGSKIDQKTLFRFLEIFTKDTESIYNGGSFNIDDDFHKTIIEACNNPYIMKMHEQISNQNSRFRVFTGQCDKQRLEKTIEEHLNILRACLKREWELAAKEMHNHLTMSKNASFDVLLKNMEK